jgi:hypothetical protein
MPCFFRRYGSTTSSNPLPQVRIGDVGAGIFSDPGPTCLACRDRTDDSSLRTMRSPKKPQFGVHLAADYGPKPSNSSRLAGSCLTTYRWLQLDYAKNRGASPDARGVTEGNRREHARTTARVHILTPAIFAGSNLRSTFPIIKGWCSPALPTNVYDLSNPFAPQTFISQPSLSREPTIDIDLSRRAAWPRPTPRC